MVAKVLVEQRLYVSHWEAILLNGFAMHEVVSDFLEPFELIKVMLTFFMV